ncbi:lipopolysaccharide assembly protein LapB [Jiulongibacter sediminis]|uniref:tetratricopeptide repeat protein n=1 Tax=Jiulongibacter sediminis TaxID=1605367 RepID=UPI0026E92A52|nr:tetratricopeptide repeat protein [Jiulongibacter sediminis]
MRLVFSISFLWFILFSCASYEREGDSVPSKLSDNSREGRLRKTLAYLKELSDEGDGEAGDYYKLAEISKELGDAENGLKYITRALQMKSSDPEYFFLKAELLSKLKREDEALQAAEEASAMELDTPKFYSFIAGLYLKKDSLSKAEEYLKESLFIAPEWRESLLLKASLLLKQQNPLAAQQYLKNAFELNSPSSEGYYLLAKSYLEMEGRLDSAFAINRKGLEIDNNYPGLFYNQAKIMERLGRIDSAIATYRKVTTLDIDEPAFADLGELYIKYGNFTRAAESFEKQIELTPDKKNFYFRAGFCLERLGQYKQAQELYLKGKTRFPDEVEIQTAYDRVSSVLERVYRSVEI